MKRTAVLERKTPLRRKSLGWKRARLNATDLLWAKAVKHRDGLRCRRCLRDLDQGWQVHAAHIMPRRHRQTKWLIENGITLCALCHLWADEHRSSTLDGEFESWVKRQIGEAEFMRLVLLAKGPKGRVLDEKLVRDALMAYLR